MPNDVAPSCSKYYVIDPELQNNKNKRKLSESEEYKDQIQTSDCETSTYKKGLCKDSQPNSGYKRSINKNNLKNDINKRIKLDNNSIFQKDDYCERVSKNLTNQEVSMLLELSYNFDDETIFDYEDKTNIQSPEVQIIMEYSKNISDQAYNFNTSITHVNDETILNNNKTNMFSEDKSLSQNNFCSESCSNQIEDISNKEIEVNYDENVTQTYGDNFDNSDLKNTDQEHIMLDLTKCVNDETMILNNNNPTSIINKVINSENSNNEEVVVMPLKNEADDINYISLLNHCDENVLNIENCDDAKTKRSSVVFTTITIPPTSDEFYFGSESCRDVSVHSIHSLERYEMNNSSTHVIETNDSFGAFCNNQIENSLVELGRIENNAQLDIKLINYDFHKEESIDAVIKQIIEDIVDSLDFLNSFGHSLTKDDRKNTVQEEKINEPSTHVNNKDHIICKSFSQNNLCYESNSNQSKEIKVNFEGNVTQTYENNFGNSSNSKNTDQEHNMLDLTKCVIVEETMLNNDNSTSIINEIIKSESISQSSFYSESNLNQSEVIFQKENEVNWGGNLTQTHVENFDNSTDPKNTDQKHNMLDYTKCLNVEGTMLNDDNSTSIINEIMNSESIVTQNVFNQVNLSESIQYDENVTNKDTKSSNNEGVIMLQENESEDVNDNILSDICDMDVTNVDSCEDAIINRSLVGSAAVTTVKTGNQFYFGSENCCDVSVQIIQPLDCYEMNNFSKNSSIHSMETNDSLDFRTNFFQERELNESILHVNNKDHLIYESLSQSSFYSECNLNQSEVIFQKEDEVNWGGNPTQTHVENFDNSTDPKNTDQEHNMLDLTKCVNVEETVLNNDNSTSIINEIIKSESLPENCGMDVKTVINCDDVSDSSIRSDQGDKLDLSYKHVNDKSILDYENIFTKDDKCERSLSLNSTNAEQILDISNGNSESFDDSLLFMPSARDLVKYGIESEENEESVIQSQNRLENYVSNKEIVPQYQSSSLKTNEVSKSINTLVSSSYAKDYEDNVKEFYDCELSSIENSDAEDNLLLSFENDSLIDKCIFDKNQEKLSNANNSTSIELTLVGNNLKSRLLDSPSKHCHTSTNLIDTPASFIYSPCHDHQYSQTVSASMSKKQIPHNKSEVSKDVQCCAINSINVDDESESISQSNVKFTYGNTINSSSNSVDYINKIQSDSLCIAQVELKSVINENSEDSNEKLIQKNVDKSISGLNTQNIIKSQKSYKDNETKSSKVSSMKLNGNCKIPKFNSEEIEVVSLAKCSSFSIDQSNLNSEIEKKKYLDEIIKNDQLFNNFDEELNVDDSVISPYIIQSLVKSASSQNLKNALATNAAAIVNTNSIGDGALCTDSTQQTMTSEVLHKSLGTCPSSSVLMEDPNGLVVPLMPHQKHAIAWLIWRESQEPHGGILADDMGLGKTLTMISLVLKSKENQLDNLLPVVSNDNRCNDVFIGGTLVVCPASLLSQWQTEVKTKLNPGLLKVGQYYGVNRNVCATELAINDLVLTSYNTIMWDFKKQPNSSPLFKIKWKRIILDEAHNIRNYKTQTSVAVCNMMSINRWAITGTPIHNKEADFYTLLKFIRCHPFDDWQVWKQWVGRSDDGGKKRLSLLVKSLMLRRTKKELSQFTTFKLPSKDFHIVEIELSDYERNAYEKLLQFSSNFFATYLYDKAAKEKLFDPSIKLQSKVQYFQEQSQVKEEVFKNHPELLKLFCQFKNIKKIETYHILVLLLRLRQMCCHPSLIKGRITEENIKKEEDVENMPEDDSDSEDNDATNSESHNENTTIVTVPKDIDLVDLMSNLTLEDKLIKKNTELIDSHMIFKKSFLSSKIKAVCDKVREKVLDNGGKEKAIVVSQWPSFLFLIRQNLAHYNVKMEMFTGDVPILKRNKIIREFNTSNGGPQILLLSLQAGGVGLNLMGANHMFLADIHWNPQLEAQACDRIYRVGQTKSVNVYKFICSNTIETRILNIQSNKLQIAENLFNGSSVVSSKITLDDLKQIFQFH